jgi:hypothetical protein
MNENKKKYNNEYSKARLEMLKNTNVIKYEEVKKQYAKAAKKYYNEKLKIYNKMLTPEQIEEKKIKAKQATLKRLEKLTPEEIEERKLKYKQYKEAWKIKNNSNPEKNNTLVYAKEYNKKYIENKKNLQNEKIIE